MLLPLYDLNPHRRFPWVTVLLILVNVGVLASEGWQPSEDVVYQYGFVPLRVSEIGKAQSIKLPVVREDRQPGMFHLPVRQQPVVLSLNPSDVYLTFLTTMFLHGNWFHLLSNMWMLWIFGNNVEDRLGRFMFLCYYLLGGMIGSVGQWAFDPLSPMPVIGASGAVATVLGGYAITYPKAMVKTLVFIGLPLLLNLPALVVLGFWFIAQVLSGVFGMMQGGMAEPVAFWAHIGGFLAGVALMPLLALGASPADADWRREAEDLFQFDDPRFRTE